MNAIVTGASRGIGKAVAHMLAGKGANLMLCARHMAGLEKVAEELTAAFPNVQLYLVEADVSVQEQAEELVARAYAAWDAVDVLVNNVGMYGMGHFTETAVEDVQQMLQTNLLAAWHLSLPVARQMKARKSGHIFNVCSVLSKEIRPEAAAYTVSKQALFALTNVMAAELREVGVRVTAVLPGSVNTSSWDGIDAPVDEFVQPIEVAHAIALALDARSTTLFSELLVKPMRPDY